MSLRCFAEDLGPPDGGHPRLITLSEQESRHARLARRLSAGDEIVLFDGRGCEATGTITATSRGSVEVAVTQVQARRRPLPELTLAVAMPKGPRQDVVIEKCTELGVAAIQPLLAERSVAGVSDHKRDKWRRATIEAAKQSGQCWLPELLAPTSLEECLARAMSFDLVLAGILPRDREPTPILDLIERIRNVRTVLALVGPEGGWTPAESDAMAAAGAIPICLGPNVLRIETAAIGVAAVLHACAKLP